MLTQQNTASVSPKSYFQVPLLSKMNSELTQTNAHDSLSCTSENQNSSHKQGRWTQDEDDLLKKVVGIYGEKQWRKISQYIPGRSAIQCLHRWTKILKPGLKKGPWTPEEDQQLVQWVKKEGPTKWAQAAAMINGRSGKQCRERWYNNLNPQVKKGEWSETEDEKIFKLFQQYGSSWSRIAKHIEGRTENAIKNRFYSTLRKLATDQKKLNGEEVGEQDGDGNGCGGDNRQLQSYLYKLLEGVQLNGNEKEFNLMKLEVLKTKPNKKYESKASRSRKKQEKGYESGLEGRKFSLATTADTISDLHFEGNCSQNRVKEEFIAISQNTKENSNNVNNNNNDNTSEEAGTIDSQEVSHFNQFIKENVGRRDISVGDKMQFLMEQLQNLENLLKATRKEILTLGQNTTQESQQQTQQKYQEEYEQGGSDLFSEFGLERVKIAEVEIQKKTQRRAQSLFEEAEKENMMWKSEEEPQLNLYEELMRSTISVGKRTREMDHDLLSLSGFQLRKNVKQEMVEEDEMISEYRGLEEHLDFIESFNLL